MINFKIIGIALAIVVLNIIVSHLFAPTGMMLTPIILIIVSSIIAFCTKKLQLIWKSLLTFGLITIHDIGIKLYAGGTHDLEGLGWVNFLFIIGLLPSYGFILITIVQNKQETLIKKIIALLIFPVLIGIYLYFY